MASRIDVEYHAFRAGLKPAIRLSADPGRTGPMVQRYEALGCAVVTADATFSTDHRSLDRPIQILYVGRTRADAEGLRDAEAPLRGSGLAPVGEAVRAVRDVGLRLGYPSCCVERCCDRYGRRFEDARTRIRKGDASLGHRSAAPRAQGRQAVQAWYAARDAWVPAPRWQLNDLLFAARASIVSFEPCTYVCDEATRFADAVLRVLAGVDGMARANLEQRLRRNVAVDWRGGRALVEVDRAAAPTIVRAEPLRSADGQVLSAANEELATTLVGRAVMEDGAVQGTDDPPTLVIPFAGGSAA